MSGKIFSKKVVIFTDGGSRGNPGPAASAAILADENGRVLKKYGQGLGTATNNEAEYQAVIFALKKLKSLIGSDQAAGTLVEVRSDSELLVSQMRGEYKILDKNIQPLFLNVWNLKMDFKEVVFTYIPREENSLADALVNETLDEAGRAQKLI